MLCFSVSFFCALTLAYVSQQDDTHLAPKMTLAQLSELELNHCNLLSKWNMLGGPRDETLFFQRCTSTNQNLAGKI